ncbi:MAG: cytochrome ubiquinol oxidase subunit I [Thermosulfidibacteraceae bacterium]
MYPQWLVPTIGSAVVIALIACFHILPSHLATGAFWFNLYIERKAVKEGRSELMEFLKKYVILILIFSFIYGSLTGVGIWFATAVSSPRAISLLIHNYVWGWATEWVFFIIEITAIYAYYYTLGKIDPVNHLRLGWIYAWGAWISMVIITGILAFMLTPGKWLTTGGFFDGFFNPTYFPQLFTRTAFMFTVASIYALIALSFVKNESVKVEIAKKAGVWGLAGLVFAFILGAWYFAKLPKEAKELLNTLPYMKTLIKVMVISLVITAIYLVVFSFVIPKYNNLIAGIISAIVLFLAILGFEGIREGIRRPYIVNYVMYGSSQIISRDLPAKAVKNELEKVRVKGFLSKLYYLPPELRTITPENKVKVGEILAIHLCSGCHSMAKDGWLRPLPKILAGMDKETIKSLIQSFDSSPYMPPFAGNEQELDAVSEYLEKIAK